MLTAPFDIPKELDEAAYIDGAGLKSATGFSLSQLASKDGCELEAGFLWQKTTRKLTDGSYQ